MDMIYWAVIALGVFIAVWLVFIAPAERRHHERKLAMLQKKIDARQVRSDPEDGDADNDQFDDARDG